MTREEIILDFYKKVCAKAEANMIKTGKLEGAHYAAMKELVDEIEKPESLTEDKHPFENHLMSEDEVDVLLEGIDFGSEGKLDWNQPIGKSKDDPHGGEIIDTMIEPPKPERSGLQIVHEGCSDICSECGSTMERAFSLFGGLMQFGAVIRCHNKSCKNLETI